MIKPFEKISKNNIDKLLKMLEAHTIIFNKNTNIPKSLVDKNSIGIIKEGYIQIVRNNYDGNNIIVEEFFENDIIASSISYVESSEYEMISKEDTNIIIIDEDTLLNIEDTSKAYYNQFIKNLFLILNEKNKIKNERLQIITKKSIRDKLLEYFSINRKKTGSVNIYLPYNYTALSDYLGVNRSALMRELKNLKDEGFIESKGHKIKLLY
ncbi:MAG: Crp/Fnr family transcriptional regulator [Bacilli bacterium]|nr:Crp/Fnr family transcriptional regulator [Bacilli bacterium]